MSARVRPRTYLDGYGNSLFEARRNIVAVVLPGLKISTACRAKRRHRRSARACLRIRWLREWRLDIGSGDTWPKCDDSRPVRRCSAMDLASPALLLTSRAKAKARSV